MFDSCLSLRLFRFTVFYFHLYMFPLHSASSSCHQTLRRTLLRDASGGFVATVLVLTNDNNNNDAYVSTHTCLLILSTGIYLACLAGSRWLRIWFGSRSIVVTFGKDMFILTPSLMLVRPLIKWWTRWGVCIATGGYHVGRCGHHQPQHVFSFYQPPRNDGR